MPLRRAIFGYRRSDVIDALERAGSQLDTLAANLDETWRAKESLRAELEARRERHEHELTRERLRGERLEAEGRDAAAQIVAEAEEQAERIRADADARVAETTSRLEHLLRVREQVLGELRGVVQAHGSLLAQVEHGHLPEREPAAAERRPVLEHVAGTGDFFPKHVELDAGPFADFAELSAFERSLARLPKIEDVYVRRFGADRAEIELRLSEERRLVDDLVRHLPYAVRVLADDGERLQLDVDVEAAAAEG
jgi:hypothetical protein